MASLQSVCVRVRLPISLCPHPASQIVETEHLLKALLEQNEAPARKILEQARPARNEIELV